MLRLSSEKGGADRGGAGGGGGAPESAKNSRHIRMQLIGVPIIASLRQNGGGHFRSNKLVRGDNNPLWL